MQLAPTLTTFVKDGSWERLVRVANALAPAMAAHYGEGREGGVLTLFEQYGILGAHIQAEIGTPDPMMIGRYHAISLEKGIRARRFGDKTSWTADRDPDRSQYGGAFLLPHLPLYVSFSGWKEIHDVKFTVLSLSRAGLIREQDIVTIFNWHDYLAETLFSTYDDFIDVFETVPV